MQQPQEGNSQPSYYQPGNPNTQYPPQQPDYRQPYPTYPQQYSSQPGYLPQQPYYPQQPPPPKKRGRGWLIGLGVVVLAFFICIAAAASTHTTTSNVPVTASAGTASSSSTQPTQAPTAPPKPQAWTTVQSFKGNGEQKTAIFSVSDDWKITWTCNPDSFYGNSYNVIVTVYNSDGTVADLAINSTCKKGTSNGITEEHQSGSIYLDIASEGDWAIAVQELK